MKKHKTIDTVRERERERVITTNVGFVCDAKNIVKNKNIDKIKKIEYHVKRKKLFRALYDTLSFCAI